MKDPQRWESPYHDNELKRLIKKGLTDSQIAKEMYFAVSTVFVHRNELGWQANPGCRSKRGLRAEKIARLPKITLNPLQEAKKHLGLNPATMCIHRKDGSLKRMTLTEAARAVNRILKARGEPQMEQVADWVVN